MSDEEEVWSQDKMDAMAEEVGDDYRIKHIQDAMAMREFLRTKVGKLIERKAIELKDQHLVKLIEIDPVDDVKAWRSAKLEVLVGMRILEWIEETLITGDHAEDAIHQEDDSYNRLNGYKPSN